MKIKRKFLLAVIILILILTCSVIFTACNKDNNQNPLGNEDPNTPEEPEIADLTINTSAELKAFAVRVNNGDNCDGLIIALDNDIDLDNEEWTPIGTDENNYFSGVFNGRNHEIINLNIRTSANCVGLFGHNKGTIKNLNITGNVIIENVTVADPRKGALVGYNKGDIINCTAQASVKSIGSSGQIGGLVGDSSGGSIKNSSFNGIVTSKSYSIGGLIGTNSSKVEKCYSTAEVRMTSVGRTAGGLIGLNGAAQITDSYATGKVSGNQNVGGLIGENNGKDIMRCYATGEVGNALVSGSESTQLAYAGGLIGYNSRTEAAITDCYSTGKVSGKSVLINPCQAVAGGLVGNSNGGTITNCFTSGEVSAEAYCSAKQYTATSIAGGLIGNGQNTTIVNCYTIGNVSIILPASNASVSQDFSIGLGGFIGMCKDIDISNCYRYENQVINKKRYNVGTSGNTSVPDSTATNTMGTSINTQDLNTASFYSDTLKFSNSIWDFSQTDISTGKYPKFK